MRKEVSFPYIIFLISPQYFIECLKLTLRLFYFQSFKIEFATNFFLNIIYIDLSSITFFNMKMLGNTSIASWDIIFIILIKIMSTYKGCICIICKLFEDNMRIILINQDIALLPSKFVPITHFF